MNPIKSLLTGMFAFAVLLNVAMLVQAQETSSPSAAPKPGLSRVVVRTLVDSSGTVKATQIRESSGNSRLDEEALQVVSKVWSFSPLKINGKGIEVWVNVPINFVQAEAPAAPPASVEPVPVLPLVVPESVPPAAQQPKVVTEPPASTGPAKPAASETAQAPAPAAAPASAPASAPLQPPAVPASVPAPPVPGPAASAAEAPASATTPAASAASAAN